MNGRIYDPTLGRFLQADPVIQDVTNPQNWNGYTYVFNNPYRYTDPSGMIGVEERQWLATAVTIAVAWYAPQLWGTAYAAAGGAYVSGVAVTASAAAAANAAVVGFVVAAGAVSGGIASGSNGAVMGAFSALAFYGIGQTFADLSIGSGSGFLGSGLTSGQFAAKALTHGIAGGVMSVIQGGKFGHGFVSAAGAQLASPMIDQIGGGHPSYAGARIVAAAIVGGTMSALTGGKFASGALTAAFGRAFNSELEKKPPYEKKELHDVAEFFGIGSVRLTTSDFQQIRSKHGVFAAEGKSKFIPEVLNDYEAFVDGIVDPALGPEGTLPLIQLGSRPPQLFWDRVLPNVIGVDRFGSPTNIVRIVISIDIGSSSIFSSSAVWRVTGAYPISNLGADIFRGKRNGSP